MLFFHLTMSLSNGLLEGGVVCLLRLAFGEEGGSDSMTSSSCSSDADAEAGCSTSRSSCTYKESPTLLNLRFAFSTRTSMHNLVKTISISEFNNERII